MEKHILRLHILISAENVSRKLQSRELWIVNLNEMKIRLFTLLPTRRRKISLTLYPDTQHTTTTSDGNKLVSSALAKII